MNAFVNREIVTFGGYKAIGPSRSTEQIHEWIIVFDELG